VRDLGQAGGYDEASGARLAFVRTRRVGSRWLGLCRCRSSSICLSTVAFRSAGGQIATLIVVDVSQKKSLELRYAYRYFMNHGWRADF